MQRLKLNDGGSVGRVLEKMKADHETSELVEFVEPVYIVSASQTVSSDSPPNDTGWRDLWGLRKIDIQKAWQRSKGSRKVIVAVIDTGIDYKHRDLSANMWKNPREVENGRDNDGNGIVGDIHGASFCTDFTDPGGPKQIAPTGNPMDTFGHGTHVAGTIAAEGNNAIDVVGVAWQAQLMAVRFLCSEGRGTTADAIRAIEYALVNGAQILHNSWGGAGYSRALEAAIREADVQGVLFVVAAGNEGLDLEKDPTYPAAYKVPNVITVAATAQGATAQDDKWASFSNWSLARALIAAPGVDILSTVPGNKVARFSGTSMAAPHVTGCAVLLKAIDPSRAPQQLISLLMNSADKVQDLAVKIPEGRRLNCGKATAAQ